MLSRCPSCSQERDAFICTTCLTKLLKLYKHQIGSHSTLLPAAEARAKNGIKAVRLNVEHAAEHWKRQANVRNVQLEIDGLRSQIASRQDALQERRKALALRRARLKTAHIALQAASSTDDSPIRPSVPNAPLPAVYTELERQAVLQAELSKVVEELAKTRQILLQELLEAFDVQVCAVPGCHYQIGTLPVPSLPELQDLPKQQLNASVGLIVMLIKLAAGYLGIQLPFTPQGVSMKPLIKAFPLSSAAQRFPKPYPLYLSSGGTPASVTQPVVGSTTVLDRPSPDTTSGPTSKGATKSATPATHAQALVIGLTMLAYDAFYLYHLSTHTADEVVPNFKLEDNHIDILGLLKQASEAPYIGRRSHILSDVENTVRDLHNAQDIYGFAAYLHYVEMRRQNQPQVATGAVTRTKERKKGKYVVVSHNDSKTGNAVNSSQKLETSAEDETWDVV